MRRMPYDEWEISVRAMNVLFQHGCDLVNEKRAKAFAYDAVLTGRASEWKNCGKKTLEELAKWSGFDKEQQRLNEAVALLQYHGYTISDSKGPIA